MNARIFLVCAAAALAAGPVLAQGPLTPPGAPGPTMKTLEQVEPRTAITNVPYAITRSGSYYLAASLTSATHGVTIATNGVTLDLMGHALSGDRSGGGYGVYVYDAGGLPLRDVVVRNGSLRGFGHGVWAKFAQSSRFEDLEVSRNLWNGILLDGLGGQCNGNAIVRCLLASNGLAAVYLNGSSGQCDGNRVVQCAINGNVDDGVQLNGDSGSCDGNLLADCAVTGNGDMGIYVTSGAGQCKGNRIARCLVNRNRDYGIYLIGTSGQVSGNLLTGCAVVSNASYGIILNGNGGRCEGNVVADCTVGENGGTGIRVNVAAGNRVENNRIYDFGGGTRYGIECVASTNNVIVANSSVGHLYDFSLSVRDIYGPVVTNIGELATSGVSAHPWANFSQ